MNDDYVELPPEMEINDFHAKAHLDMANGAVDAAVAGFGQPVEMAEPTFGTSRASRSHDAEMGEVFGATNNSLGNSHDSIATGDGVLFWHFKHLPAEIRTMIWLAAAEAAKPRGVYQFKYMQMPLQSGYQYPSLADGVMAPQFRLDMEEPRLTQDLLNLISASYHGFPVLTFTPSAEVGIFTREIRYLFRCCPEARSELMRHPVFGSSFDFHWIQRGKCNFGTMRPFHYDTDWICLSGLRPIWPGRNGYNSLLYTPDISRVQHLALDYAELNPRVLKQASGRHLHILSLLDGLKSFGYYQPSYSIKRVPHWDSLISSNQRLFLKGVPLPASGAAPGPPLNGRAFRMAMRRLYGLVDVVHLVTIHKRMLDWHAHGIDLGGLQYCLLLHADSQDGLDLMKFEEDGSHLDDVDRIEDLGALGQKIKAVQVEAAIPAPGGSV